MSGVWVTSSREVEAHRFQTVGGRDVAAQPGVSVEVTCPVDGVEAALVTLDKMVGEIRAELLQVGPQLRPIHVGDERDGVQDDRRQR